MLYKGFGRVWCFSGGFRRVSRCFIGGSGGYWCLTGGLGRVCWCFISGFLGVLEGG